MIAMPGLLGACTTTAEDIAYPDLARMPVTPPPTGFMTPAEKKAAIEEMRTEAKANAQRGL